MALLYGRAGRLTAKTGGFRPGQYGGVSASYALQGDVRIGVRPPAPPLLASSLFFLAVMCTERASSVTHTHPTPGTGTLARAPSN
jgi:hypothetical protein